LEFCGGIAVAGFVEEPASDVVADGGFLQAGGGQLERFLLQDCGFVPAVLAVEDLGQDQQQLCPVEGILLLPEAFPEGVAAAVQQRQVPDPFEERDVAVEGALERLRVYRCIAQRHRVGVPGI